MLGAGAIGGSSGACASVKVGVAVSITISRSRPVWRDILAILKMQQQRRGQQKPGTRRRPGSQYHRKGAGLTEFTREIPAAPKG